jgi:hypothetical protein
MPSKQLLLMVSFGDYRREFNWTVNTDLPNIDILKYQEPLPWFPRARRQLHF